MAEVLQSQDSFMRRHRSVADVQIDARRSEVAEPHQSQSDGERDPQRTEGQQQRPKEGKGDHDVPQRVVLSDQSRSHD